MPVHALFNDLVQILEKQNEILAGLLDAAREHSRALQGNNPAAIMAAVAKQENLSGALAALEQERASAQGQLTGPQELRGEAALRLILTHAPSPAAAGNLERLWRNMKENLTQLVEISRLNRLLAKRGLLFAERLSSLALPRGNDTYLQSGVLQKAGPPLSLMNKTI